MRIGILGEGTYPVAHGGVSTWTDQLISQMPDHDFTVVTLVGTDRKVLWDLPANVSDVTLLPMWDTPSRPPRLGGRLERAHLRRTLALLWASALPSDPDLSGPEGARAEADRLANAESALRRLATPRRVPLSALLYQNGSAEAILRAWDRHRRLRPHVPEMSLAQAAEVARLADRMLAVVDAPWPEVDVIHVASNGPAALIALARHWTTGTPIVLTEHGIYLRERYLALGSLELDWTVRYALMGLIRAICRVTYSTSAILAPVSDFNASWERQLGAQDSKIVTVHNAADTTAFAPVTTEPDVPTVSFVGRIDPLKDLDTLIRAFGNVHAVIPEAKLRLFGPVPRGNEAYRRALDERVLELGLENAVTFEGSVPTARPAIEAGHVVALSSISEGLPFTVIEAMMCGRATVNTDVGGVSECTGTDGTCGLVVPPRDPAALASALLTLLTDDDRRHAVGAAARERALAMFGMDLFLRRFRHIYDAALTPTIVPAALGRLPAASPVPPAATVAPASASAPSLPVVVGQPRHPGPGRQPRPHTHGQHAPTVSTGQNAIGQSGPVPHLPLPRPRIDRGRPR